MIHSFGAAQRNKMSGTACAFTLLLLDKPQKLHGALMVNTVVMWVCAHPLEFVGGLAVGCALMGVLLIPRLSELPGHGHPRC
jgi:hypothetical protein